MWILYTFNRYVNYPQNAVRYLLENLYLCSNIVLNIVMTVLIFWIINMIWKKVSFFSEVSADVKMLNWAPMIKL